MSIEAPYYDFSQPAMTTQDNISVHPSNPSSHTIDESTAKMTEEVEEDDNASTFFLTQVKKWTRKYIHFLLNY